MKTHQTKSLALCLAVLLAPVSAWAATATIEFKLNRSFRKGKHVPTYVVWVETKDGEYVATVRMGKTAKGQHVRRSQGKKGGCFKAWQQAEFDITEADAVTKASPWPGQTDSFTWGLTNDKGETVPKGDYVLKLESAAKGKPEFAQVTAMPFTIGSRRKKKFSKSITASTSGSKISKKVVYVQKLTLRIKK